MMKKEELTFEQAWNYLKIRWELRLFNISKVAEQIGIDRSTLCSALHGSIDKTTGKPVVIAEKHYGQFIEFMKFMQTKP